MFKVTTNGINRLDIELSGKLDAEEMKITLDELVNKSNDIENGKMLYEIIDFHLPSLGAIGIEFSRLPSTFSLIVRRQNLLNLELPELRDTLAHQVGM